MFQGRQPPGRGEAESYTRLRHQVVGASSGKLRSRVRPAFPEALDTSGKTWSHQVQEAKVLMAEMAGWLGGVVESQVLDRRIRAEAEERAKL